MLQPRLIDTFKKMSEGVQFASLRWQNNETLWVNLRNDTLEPVEIVGNSGFMVTVTADGGMGYAASSDLTERGVAECFHAARKWAELSAGRSVFDFSDIEYPHLSGARQSAVGKSWHSLPLQEKISLLQPACKSLKTSDRIVMRETGVLSHRAEVFYLTSQGGQVQQTFERLIPSLVVTAGDGKGEFETRTFGRGNTCWQSGYEMLEQEGFFRQAEILAHEAEALLSAPSCPSGTHNLLLAPDQMVLQIHESIGHPLELDRILGDERNYAGTSFVTLDMFGKYQYGSELLNITFDPTVPQEVASYAFDDEGSAAEKTYLIRDGRLLLPLGGLTSQRRAGVEGGVACTRACQWNRPAIDRMANLNLEAGNLSMDDLLQKMERGIYMQTNSSWSIDDSRNKFQFGCEIAYQVEGGRIKNMLKRPNYRGISANFWRSLDGVGDKATVKVMGSPYCGKGEPNQSIYVGHASPACLFSGVEVFGGGA